MSAKENEGNGKRVLILGGSGGLGVRAGSKLAASDLVSEIGVAGRNLEKLDRAVAKVGKRLTLCKSTFLMNSALLLSSRTMT